VKTENGENRRETKQSVEKHGGNTFVCYEEIAPFDASLYDGLSARRNCVKYEFESTLVRDAKRILGLP